MGACASVPKDLKAEAGAAPPPEPPKEETTTAEALEVNSEVKAEEGEKKVDGTGDDKPKNDDMVVKDEKVTEDSDKHQSLGTLMNDKDEAKQESSTSSAGAEAVPSTTVKAEEDDKVDPADHSPLKKDDDEKKPSTDIAEVTKEEKKNEETIQKS